MESESNHQYSRIDAKLLIPGRGEPLQDASLVHSQGVILWVDYTNRLPVEYREVKAIDVHVLMPGLWDCHTHFLGMYTYSLDVAATTNPTVAGIRSARDATACLNAGFTSIRELAGYGVQLAQVIDEGWIAGPNIYSSVSILSQTAGHGDCRTVPLDRFCDLMNHQGIPFHLCDGVSECIKAVRIQIRKGAKVIKVATSGGVTSEGDDVTVPQFNEEELDAIVKESNRNNLAVAAHAHGKPGIIAALKAGCRTIEHGTYLDDEAIALMLEKDSILVATSAIPKYIMRLFKEGSPEWNQIRKVMDIAKNSYRKAVLAGVRCAIGTDIGPSAHNSPPSFGMNGEELEFAVAAGMTPLQAIEAGTANGPETLGPKAPKSGWLKAGYDADLIGLNKNPLDDIKVLADSNQIIHVWKNGKHVKKNGQPINMDVYHDLP